MFKGRKTFEIGRKGKTRLSFYMKVGLTDSGRDSTRARPERLVEATPAPAPPRRAGDSPKDDGGAGRKLQVARKRLAQGPAVEAPSRLGRAGRFARRLVLRSMRPFASYQGQLDTAMIGAIQETTQKIKKVRSGFENRQKQLEGRLDALESGFESRQERLEGRLDALDAKLSEVVAGIEVGSVPARETLYLGHPFLYPYDSSIGDLISRGNEWDAFLRAVVSELLPKEEPTICEVGSNIGASLLQILAAKPRAHVVAFEPSARFRPFLERNLELAGFDHVEVFPLLVGRNPGSMWLYGNNITATVVSAVHPDSHPRHSYYESRGKELVEMTTLDEVFRDRGPVDFIKIDTDGFDLEVLRGAEATLERDRPILKFELEPRFLNKLAPSAPIEDLVWLQSVGYRRLVCLNPAGQLVGTTEDPEQAIAWADANVNCDVLACPEGSASEARLGSMEFG